MYLIIIFKKLVKKNNIKVIKYNQDVPDDFDKYWFVCLNNVLHAVGEKGLISKNPKVESKCVNFKSNDNFVEYYKYKCVEKNFNIT